MSAKKNAAPAPVLRSWGDVNDSLRKMAEAQIAIDVINSDMNTSINDAKLKAETLIKPMSASLDSLHKQIEAFVTANKAEIKGKSIELNFGSAGFRKTTQITWNTRKTPEIIAALKSLGMDNCVTFAESVNKNVLGTYPDADIKKAGANRKISDVFFCEPDIEKVRG